MKNFHNLTIDFHSKRSGIFRFLNWIKRFYYERFACYKSDELFSNPRYSNRSCVIRNLNQKLDDPEDSFKLFELS